MDTSFVSFRAGQKPDETARKCCQILGTRSVDPIWRLFQRTGLAVSGSACLPFRTTILVILSSRLVVPGVENDGGKVRVCLIFFLEMACVCVSFVSYFYFGNAAAEDVAALMTCKVASLDSDLLTFQHKVICVLGSFMTGWTDW